MCVAACADGAALHEPFRGGLGSYSVLVMAISLLQHYNRDSSLTLAQVIPLFFLCSWLLRFGLLDDLVDVDKARSHSPPVRIELE